MKIIKWLAILSFTAFTIVILYWVGFAILFSHGAGSGSEGKIEMYEFKADSISLNNQWIKILEGNKEIEIKQDTVAEREYISPRIVLIIKIKKSDYFKICYYHSLNKKEEPVTVFYLVRVNGKKEDDFGWFSFEKYKKVKLFEEEIIKPLSQKFERVEVE